MTAVVTDGDEASAKILWTTFNEGMGWVELEDGTRIYDSFAGRRAVDSFHSVTLSGLSAGQTVRYRVGGQALTDGSDPSYPEFSDEYVHPWDGFKALDNSSDACRFTMINDIHLNLDAYGKLASQIDHPNKSSYQLHRYMNKTVVPLLNEAGIDLMLGADLPDQLARPGTF